jgi:hypothetical protein
LINRRSTPPRLLLALTSEKDNANHKNNPIDLAELTRSLNIRAMHSLKCRHTLTCPLIGSRSDRGHRTVANLDLARDILLNQLKTIGRNYFRVIRSSIIIRS